MQQSKFELDQIKFNEQIQIYSQFNDNDDYQSDCNYTSNKDLEQSKARRKRSDRVKQRQISNGNSNYTSRNQDKVQDKQTNEIQIQSLNTIDQFANFLLQKQTNDYSYYKHREEDNEEQEDSEDDEEEEDKSNEYNQDEVDNQQYSDVQQEYVEEDELSQQRQNYDHYYDENQQFIQIFQDQARDCQVDLQSNNYQSDNYNKQQYDKQNKQEEEEEIELRQTEQSFDERKVESNNNDFIEPMSIKESPIKRNLQNTNHEIDLSYINKNDTPSIINKKSQFSPTSPISQFNNLVNNITPKGNQMQQIDYNDSDYYEENQFKETIKSQSTDIKSALNDNNYYYQQNNHKQSPMQKSSSQIVFNNAVQQKQDQTHQVQRTLSQSNLQQNISDKQKITQQQQQQQQSEIQRNNFILMQYEVVLQQLNGQIQKLLSRNQELEQTNLSNELIISQSKQIINELQLAFNNEKMSSDIKIEQILKEKEQIEIELEKHKQILTIYSNELEVSRQTSFDLESRLQLASQQQVVIVRNEQDLKIKVEELQGKIRQVDTYSKLKDDEIYKLRQDNQSMFHDLKEFAQSEEQMKIDLIDAKNSKQELEHLCDDLREKCQNQEHKLKTLQNELDRLRKETQSKGEQTKLQDIEILSLKDENNSLREKLQNLDQEKSNLLGEKERREKDCRNMQTELNRFNTMIHTIKNMSGGGEMKLNQDIQLKQTQLQKQAQEVEAAAQIQWLQKQQQHQQNNESRNVLKNSDLNQFTHYKPEHYTPMTWVHGQNQMQSEHNGQNGNAHKRIVDTSPIKKLDPNISYAQRQKIIQNHTYQGYSNESNKVHSNNVTVNAHSYKQQQLNAEQANLQLQLQHFISEKQRLESEYQKMPITINNKSLQVIKKKEDLEFELDSVEKNISKIILKLKDNNSPVY